MTPASKGAGQSRMLRSGQSRALRGLLAGVSILALAAAAAPGAAAERPFTPGWYQERAKVRRTVAATAAGGDASGLTSAQRAQVDRSLAAMTRVTAAVRSQLAAQATASAAARLQSNPAGVADGVQAGGLVPYPGAATDDAVRAQGLVWNGASLPTEARSGSSVTVSIQQTERKAILTWQTFNVGRNTTLDFIQRSADGTPQRDWVALNRVVAGPADANGRRQVASPSQILGQIRAEGEVYIINQNGIIFGGGSQVNVRSLVASSLDVGYSNQRLSERNAYFLAPAAGRMSFSFQHLLQDDGSGEGIEEAHYTKPIDAKDGSTSTAGAVFAADAVEGSVEVDEGALIRTHDVGSEGALGRVALIAPQVVNRGQIDTASGQTLLVGARNATLFSNEASALTSTGLSVDANLRGALVLAGALDPISVRVPLIHGSTVSDGRVTPPSVDGRYCSSLNLRTSAQAYAGSVTNTGIVTAERGNISLTGSRLTQAGVLFATTSVNANGSIYLRAFDAPYVTVSNAGNRYIGTPSATAGFVRLTDGSVVSILADTQIQADGSIQTIPAGSVDAFKSSVVEISLANGYNSALIGLTTQDGLTYPSAIFNRLNFPTSSTASVSGQIDVAAGSLIKAPGARLSLSATTTPLTPAQQNTPGNASARANILVRDGAAIDVSGLMAVPVSMEDNLVTIPVVTANDLADSPLQREGVVRNRTDLVVDRRATGLRSDGTRWYGTPLFDANGYISAQGLPVEQLLVEGGDVSINGTTILQAGSLISVAGGYKQYSGGTIQTTTLATADGHVFGIGRADPTFQYSGIAGQFTERHDRWGQTKTYNGLSLVGGRSHYEPGYLEGGDAGSLAVSGLLIIEGQVDGGAIQGPYQRAGGPYLSIATEGASLDFTNSPVSTLLFQPTQLLRLGSGSLATDTFALATFLTQTWSAEWLQDTGASDLRFGNRTTYDGAAPSAATTQTVRVNADTDLRLPAGGRITINGRNIDVAGRITAPSGAITFNLSTYPSKGQVQIKTLERSTFTLRQGAVLDVAGLWVHDRGTTLQTFVGSDDVDGGAVTIRSTSIDAPTTSGTYQFPIPDVSSVVFESGSVVDLSSGGYVASDGRLKRDAEGVAIGSGGDLAIVLHPGTQTPNVIPIDQDTAKRPPSQRAEQIDDTLVLNGVILASGFQGGGTFTLRAPVIAISGGGAAGGTGGEFNLPASFFEQGFSAYDLTALLRASIAPGTQIRLRQQQLQPTPQANFALSRAGVVTPGFNLGLQRTPVSFSLTSLGYTDYANALQAVLRLGGTTYRGQSFTSANALIVGAGSLIEADAGASVAFSSRGQLTFAGSILAPGGAVSLTQRVGIAPNLGAFDFVTGALQLDIRFGGTSLFLAPTAVIDARGTTVLDPRQPYLAGEVLAGGQVSLSADNLIA